VRFTWSLPESAIVLLVIGNVKWTGRGLDKLGSSGAVVSEHTNEVIVLH
jgi:hypothetical protein